MGRMDKNKRSNYMLSNEDSVEMKRDVPVKVKGWKTYSMQIVTKRGGYSNSDKIDFESIQRL